MRAYDAIIILSNEMGSDGTLNQESIARANYAIRLTDKLNPQFIITSGWAYRQDSLIDIADAVKAYLIKCGLNSEKIITDSNSRDTVGDAFFSRVNIVEPLKLNKICVVTSNYHVPRTQKIFNFIYGSGFSIDVVGAKVDVTSDIVRKEMSSSRKFKQTFQGVKTGNIKEIYTALRSRHPFYNGEVHEKI